jgi:hypothetical protein
MAQRPHQRPQQDDRHQRRGGRERDQQDGARVVEVITRQNRRIRSPIPRRSLTVLWTGLPAAVG